MTEIEEIIEALEKFRDERNWQLLKGSTEHGIAKCDTFQTADALS